MQNAKLDLCDIWQVRNPEKMQYTFRQQRFSGLIQGRLDYSFVSHNLPEVVKYSEILCAILIIQLFFVLFIVSTNLKKIHAYGNLTIL